MYKIPAKIEVVPIGAENMNSQLYFDVFIDGRKRYSGMSAAGVIDVIKEQHDLHEANRKEHYTKEKERQ